MSTGRTTKKMMDMACRNKKLFKTLNDAKKVGDFWNQTPYKCPYCGFWHLSSMKEDSE